MSAAERLPVLTGEPAAEWVAIEALRPWKDNPRKNDGEPVRLFFLIVGPDSSAGRHVKLLSQIARLVRRENVRQRLVDARTPDEFHRILVDAEAR